MVYMGHDSWRIDQVGCSRYGHCRPAW